MTPDAMCLDGNRTRSVACKPPLEAVVRGLRAAADAVFEERRAAVTCREKIVAATPELRERELRKQADLADAITDALRARGTDPDTASLAASAGLLVQQTAMRSWTRSAGDRPLRDFLSDALVSLRKVADA